MPKFVHHDQQDKTDPYRRRECKTADKEDSRHDRPMKIEAGAADSCRVPIAGLKHILKLEPKRTQTKHTRPFPCAAGFNAESRQIVNTIFLRQNECFGGPTVPDKPKSAFFAGSNEYRRHKEGESEGLLVLLVLLVAVGFKAALAAGLS